MIISVFIEYPTNILISLWHFRLFILQYPLFCNINFSNKFLIFFLKISAYFLQSTIEITFVNNHIIYSHWRWKNLNKKEIKI